MDLTPHDRVALRLADGEWKWRRIRVATVRRLKRDGLLEDRRTPGSYETRLTEKGLFVRDRLPPEPRPTWHDPEWQRTNWNLDHLPGPVSPTEDERLAFGWYDGQPTSPVPGPEEEARSAQRLRRRPR